MAHLLERLLLRGTASSQLRQIVLARSAFRRVRVEAGALATRLPSAAKTPQFFNSQFWSTSTFTSYDAATYVASETTHQCRL
jgi:predicted Zn-dependent peptidase